MGRKIVVLSDGTGNAAGKLFRTNIWRVYQALDLSTDQQIAFYDDGVGNSSFKPLALLGGALGWGLKRNVIDLYTFICENYREGDQIYGFGFSRGAFTIRVLTRFVLSQGLVKSWDSTDDLKRQARTLYRRFRSEQKTRFGLETLGRLLRDGFLYATSWIVHFSAPKEPQVVYPKFEFLGLWDTVDAYGLPIYELKVGIDKYLWPLALEDRDFDPKRIRYACHALSIDDRRTTFHPLLWDESGKTFTSRPKSDRGRLNQVWFAGVHSNLGGGYPDDALSYVSLRWMLREAIRHGLVFNEIMLQQYLATATPYGTLYDSRKGLAGYYRYDPRRLNPPVDNQGARISCPKIHESVFQRMAGGSDEYAPLSLPNDFKVVRVSAEELDLVKFQRDVATEKGPRKAPAIVNFERLSLPVSNQAGGENGHRLERPDDESLEIVWDTVFWRRVSYFAALAFTLLLLVYPALPKGGETAWTILAVLALPLIAILLPLAVMAQPAIKLLADIAEGVLPSVAKPWIETFQSDPWKVSFLIAAIAVSLLLGALLDRRIKDRARAAWNPRRLQVRIENSVARSRLKRVLGMAAALILSALFVASVFASNRIVQSVTDGRPCDDCRETWEHVQFYYLALVEKEVIAIGVIIISFWFWCFVLAVAGIAMMIWMPKAPGAESKVKSEIPSAALSFARACRQSKWLNAAYERVTGRVVPALFAMTVVFAVIVAANRLGFSYMNAVGSVCKASPQSWHDMENGERFVIPFEFRNGCTALEITIPAKEGGGASEKHVALSPEERIAVAFLPEHKMGLTRTPGPDDYIKTFSYKWYYKYLMGALVPFRRNLSMDWFVPILHAGTLSEGFDEHRLDVKYLELESKDYRQLFVYVNDAVFGLPFIWDASYRYNRDSGFIVVKKVRKSESILEEEEDELREIGRKTRQDAR